MAHELREWAVRGAMVRLAELRKEEQEIYDALPELKRQRATVTDGRAKRKRRTLSATAKQAISKRMKQYWATRRAAGTKKK